MARSRQRGSIGNYPSCVFFVVFSERELVHVRYMLSPVRRLSVVCLSVTFVRPTQAVHIFGNISTVFGTLAIR